MAYRILKVPLYLIAILLPAVLSVPTCHELVIPVHIIANNAVRDPLSAVSFQDLSQAFIELAFDDRY